MPLVPLLLSLAAMVGALICQIRADQHIHQNVNMEEVLVMTTYGSMLYLSVIIFLLLVVPVLFHRFESAWVGYKQQGVGLSWPFECSEALVWLEGLVWPLADGIS